MLLLLWAELACGRGFPAGRVPERWHREEWGRRTLDSSIGAQGAVPFPPEGPQNCLM